MDNLPESETNRIGLFELCFRLTGQKDPGGAWKNALKRNATRNDPLPLPEQRLEKVPGWRKATPCICKTDIANAVRLVLLRPTEFFNDVESVQKLEQYMDANAIAAIKNEVIQNPTDKACSRTWSEPNDWRTKQDMHNNHYAALVQPTSIVIASRALRDDREAGNTETGEISQYLFLKYGILEWPLFQPMAHNSSGQMDEEPVLAERKAIINALQPHRSLLEGLYAQGRLIAAGKPARLVLNSFLGIEDEEIPTLDHPSKWSQWSEGRPEYGIPPPYDVIKAALDKVGFTCEDKIEFNSNISKIHSKYKSASNKRRWETNYDDMKEALGNGNRAARADLAKSSQWQQKLETQNYKNEIAQAKKSRSLQETLAAPEQRQRRSELAIAQHMAQRFRPSGQE